MCILDEKLNHRGMHDGQGFVDDDGDDEDSDEQECPDNSPKKREVEEEHKVEDHGKSENIEMTTIELVPKEGSLLQSELGGVPNKRGRPAQS